MCRTAAVAGLRDLYAPWLLRDKLVRIPGLMCRMAVLKCTAVARGSARLLLAHGQNGASGTTRASHQSLFIVCCDSPSSQSGEDSDISAGMPYVNNTSSAWMALSLLKYAGLTNA
jgi:hypothetical protein